MIKAVENRIRVFAFGIAVALVGLFDPRLALQATAAVLNRQAAIDAEIDRLHK